LQQGEGAEQIDPIGRFDIVVRDEGKRGKMNDPIRPRELTTIQGERIRAAKLVARFN